MAFRFLFRMAALIALVAGLALYSAPARADFILTITDVTGGHTSGAIHDNGPIDGSTAGGNITFNNSGGGFASFDTNSNITATAGMVPGVGFVSSTFIAIRNATPGTIEVSIEATVGLTPALFPGGFSGFTFPGAPMLLLESTVDQGSMTGTGGGKVTLQSYASPTGVEGVLGPPTTGPQTGTAPGGVNQPIPITPQTATPFAFVPGAGGTASATQVWDFFIPANTVYNLGATTTLVAAIPEPSSLAIAGLGALGLIGYGIRRRRGA